MNSRYSKETTNKEDFDLEMENITKLMDDVDYVKDMFDDYALYNKNTTDTLNSDNN